MEEHFLFVKSEHKLRRKCMKIIAKRCGNMVLNPLVWFLPNHRTDGGTWLSRQWMGLNQVTVKRTKLHDKIA